MKNLMYKGGHISRIKVPTLKKCDDDVIIWGGKAWKFLLDLRSIVTDSKSEYATLLKDLKKILTVGDMKPEKGMYFAKHFTGQEDKFSKALKEYIKQGTDEKRVEKIKELREYYKKNVVKLKAGLTIVGNQQLAEGKDPRKLTDMTEITIGGKMWKEIPTTGNPDLFKNLTSLEKLFLGPEVEKIGPNCFEGCEKLKKIEVEGTGKAIEVDENAFKGCTQVTKVEGDKERTKNLRDMFMKGILAGKKGTIGSTLSAAFSGSKSAKKSVKKDVKDSGSDKSNVLEQLSNKKEDVDPALSSDSRKSTENPVKKDVKNSGSDKSNVLEQLSNKKENVGFWLSSSKLKSVQKSAKKS